MSEADAAEATLVEFLRSSGVADDVIESAAEDGLLPLVAIERFALTDEPQFALDEVANLLGFDEELLESMWLALGFPRPRAGEELFTPKDLDMLRDARELINSGMALPATVLNMTRVLGASMARVAEVQTDMVARQDEPAQLEAGLLLFGDVFVRLLERVWRRHLVIAARTRLNDPSGLLERQTTVGFADLVGFTAMSQQIDAHALAQVVERFEQVAFAIIERFEGRVVKMIGDEVMFEVTDPIQAALCALELAESYHEADDLSDVRVGLAAGSVIERDGDLYGPTVNLASRITSIALPGSVVVDESIRDAVGEQPEDFEVRAMLPRRLKHIGRTALWVVRAATKIDTGAGESRRERRRARVIEAVADR